MKKSTVYTALSLLLLAVAVGALLASFAVYFLPGLLRAPVLTVGQSLGLFTVGYLALAGMARAQDAAHTYRNTVEHPQWLAQRGFGQRASSQRAQAGF